MGKWKRKIQKTGPGSLGLNLPAAWLRQHEIEQKNSVVLIEEGNHLIVSPERGKENEE